MVGNALFGLNRYADALVAYDKANGLTCKLSWCNKGNALYKLGSYDEAIKAYDCALELDKDYLEAWNGQG
jgi:tetratricopeptide (TPR) repeat protein